MIEVTSRSRELSKVEEYLMTLSPSIESLKTVADGTSIAVDGYLTFTDTKEDSGEIVSLLSIITPDKKVYSCQSETFTRSFNDICNVMGGEAFAIIKTSDTSKAGRPFINCELDLNSVNV